MSRGKVEDSELHAKSTQAYDREAWHYSQRLGPFFPQFSSIHAYARSAVHFSRINRHYLPRGIREILAADPQWKLEYRPEGAGAVGELEAISVAAE